MICYLFQFMRNAATFRLPRCWYAVTIVKNQRWVFSIISYDYSSLVEQWIKLVVAVWLWCHCKCRKTSSFLSAFHNCSTGLIKLKYADATGCCWRVYVGYITPEAFTQNCSCLWFPIAQFASPNMAERFVYPFCKTSTSHFDAILCCMLAN